MWIYCDDWRQPPPNRSSHSRLSLTYFSGRLRSTYPVTHITRYKHVVFGYLLWIGTAAIRLVSFRAWYTNKYIYIYEYIHWSKLNLLSSTILNRKAYIAPSFLLIDLKQQQQQLQQHLFSGRREIYRAKWNIRESAFIEWMEAITKRKQMRVI